jgi:hypothetical protein
MDYSKAINSVADTIKKGSKPLTEAQKSLLAGAMAVWLDVAYKKGYQNAILNMPTSDNP